MDNLVETLWTAFAAESQEHLDMVEPLVAGADGEPPNKDGIAQLFRSFHSLKGLARGMDMRAMEAVAHRAETLLGQVRAGERPLAGPLIGLLLDAIDTLKALRDLAVLERRDGAPAEALLRRLEAAAAEGGPAAAPAAPPVASDGDAEMADFFAELLKGRLPALGEACTTFIPGGPEAAAAQASARAIAGELAHAATVMQFPALAVALKALDHPISGGDDWSLVHLLGEIEDAVQLIEADSGRDCGAADFAASVAWLSGEFAQRLHLRLGTLVADVCEERSAAEMAVLARQIADAAGDLAHCFCLFTGRPRSGRAAFLLADFFGRLALGDFHATSFTLAKAAALAAMLDPRQEGDGTTETDDLSAELRRALFRDLGGEGGEQAAVAVRRHLRQERVPDDLVGLLTPEIMVEAAQVMGTGCDHAHVVEARLDHDREVAQRFVAWIKSDARALTNRNIPPAGEDWLQFLILSREDVPGVAARLAAIDPSGRCLRLVSLAPAAESGKREDAGATYIRVPNSVIDRFMAQIGEMVLARSTLSLAVEDQGAAAALVALRKGLDGVRGLPGAEARLIDLSARLDQIEEQQRRIAVADQHLHGVLKRLQEGALELRVVPIDTVFSRFPRIVRDLSQRTGKRVRLELDGRDVRIDKGMVELLVDPLSHMVRNAIDHGLETPEQRQAAGKPPLGQVRLTAAQRGNRIVVEISDDGRGMDPAKLRRKAVQQGLVGPTEAAALSDEAALQLIFQPGFSTAEQVSETSGRGVGMDVVNTNVARMGGHIGIDSRLGEGSRFVLTLPLSAAIQDVLLVEVQGRTYAIPDRFLVEIHEAARGDLRSVQGRAAILLRREYLPIFTLAELLGMPDAGPRRETLPVLVLASGARRMGVAVDRLARRHELYIKDVHPRLLAVPGVGGASVLGDGRVVVILDVEGLFRLAGRPASGQAVPSLAAE